MAVTVTDRGLRVGEKDVPLILGAMHYWRLDHRKWPDLLTKIAGMGFAMIETYVPWGVHEIRRGRFDFGEKDPRKDIDRFLSLCAGHRMWVLVRPGPHINAELTYFGYPERVVADPECQAVSAQGTPVILPFPPRAFPVPSYASEEFYGEAALWFDAVCPIIKKHLYPEGRIIAVQADNEMSYFFRTNAYDLDYSEGSQKLYHRFLEEKYEDIGVLNNVYGTRYLRFVDVGLPVRFDAGSRTDLPYYLDWAEYKEYYLTRGLSRIRDMLRERGIRGVPITHNYPPPDAGTPFNIPAVEQELDLQGCDMYLRRTEYHSLKRGCLEVGAQSRLPFLPEFGSGGWFWYPPLTFTDQEFITLAAWMHGIRAISYYMLVERERWFGSPVLRDGRVRKQSYEFYTRLNAVIRNAGLLDCAHQAKFLLTRARSYQRLWSAATLFEPAPPMFLRTIGVSPEAECSEEHFDFSRPIQTASLEQFRGWSRAIGAAKYMFHIGDTAMGSNSAARYPVQIVPTFEFLGRREQERLLAYARGGGVLVIGPDVPLLDERMAPCTLMKDGLKNDRGPLEGFSGANVFGIDQGKIVVSEGLPHRPSDHTNAVDALSRLAGIQRWFPASDPDIDTSYYAHSSGNRGVLFVANPTDSARTAFLSFNGHRSFTDLWSQNNIEGRGSVAIEMPPYSVRMLEVG